MSSFRCSFFSAKLVCAACMVSLLAACAGPQSYVALLPSPDGSLGKVVVQGQRGGQLLTKAQQGALLDGSKPPFEVSNEQLQRDFGAAMRARPAAPEQFCCISRPGAPS